jgi:hypothetical protein
VYPDDRPTAQNPPDKTPVGVGTPQPAVVCPYCRKPLTTRADMSFTCSRCGDFPNYGRMYTAAPR